MDNKKITNIKKNSTKNATLLKESGYESIYQAKKDLQVSTAKEAYAQLKERYKFQNKINKKEEAKQKAKLAREAKKLDIKKMVNYIEDPNLKKLYNGLKVNRGKNIVVDWVVDGKIKKSVNYSVIDGKQFYKWFDTIFRNDWWYDSEEDVFQNLMNGLTEDDPIPVSKLFIYPKNENISSKKVIQYFRDGITHCVFTPIRNWAVEKLEGAESQRTKERYTTIVKRLNELENKYATGLPDDCVAEVCNSLQIDINIELPLCEHKFIEGKSLKKRLTQFTFMNTRLNHIELNEVVYNSKPAEVTREQLYELKNKLDANNEFYTFRKDKNGLSKIITLKGEYALFNNYGECVNKFEIDTGLNFCKIDDIDDKALCEFIQEGVNYNATVDFCDVSKINIKSINHIDMTKAYANFSKCFLYEGFLGKITDFRQTDKIVGVGYYKITNLNFDNCFGRFKKLNDKMKIYLNNNVYTSAELKLLTCQRVTYTIVCGCWGVQPIDFEFSCEMMNEKDENVPYYSKWCGASDSHKLEKTFWIKGDTNFASVLKTNEDSSVRWYENGEICIAFPKKHNYHLAHITGFITAYQRISVLDQLMEFEYDNIVRVCVDGIYFKNCVPMLRNVFRLKNDKMTFGNLAGESYVSKAIEKDLVINGFISRDHFAKELHLGEGGCGKTHFNCNDKGLIRPLFIAPSWKLARAKQNEIGIASSVWARALTDDPQRISYIKAYSNVLIVDEVSMLSQNQKLKLFELYGDMKIIFCGDLGYQLPCIEGDEMDNNGFDNIVKHKTDYRCKCPLLKQIKDDLRFMISYDRPVDEINNSTLSQFKKLGRVINISELKQMYNINDMILSGTNAVKDFYTDLFKGKFDVDKYYITENNRLYCNGDIVIGAKPENTKCEERHCFTTHSIQGETASHKLFIDSSKMFDSRMFYTAISRAKTLDQIYIIENDEIECEYQSAKIYRIVSKYGVYIGSTCKELKERFKGHKQSFKQHKKGVGKFVTSFPLLEDNDAKMELIENYPCNTKNELYMREKEYINMSDCVNKTFKDK